MKTYSLGHLADGTLLLQLAELVLRDHTTTAALLAHVAEVDERRLYAPAGYESMYAYCVGELHMSEDATCTRIRAARLARQFPAAFPSLADGRLHLSGLIQLAKHLDEANAEDLIAAAAYRTKSQIEQLLAERFPQRDVAASLLPIGSDVRLGDLSVPERMDGSLDLVPERPGLSPLSVPERMNDGLDLVPERAGLSPLSVPERMNSGPGAANRSDGSMRSTVKALAPQRYALQCTLDQPAHDDLRQLEALLGRRNPSGDIAGVIGYALRVARERLEKRKVGAGTRSRPAPGVRDGRYVPAQVKSAVWKRDAGRCTFVSDTGHRCEARKFIEFDHVEPVARGGKSTVANVRLRCRAHNRYEAERALGADFMLRKRELAQRLQTDAGQGTGTERARAEATEAERSRAQAAEKARAATEQVRAATEAHATNERARSGYSPRFSSSRNASP